MIRSMTAFSRVDETTEVGEVSWEIRSVNHRYLDVSLSLPEGFQALENKFKSSISGKLKRGKLDARLRYQLSHEIHEDLILNEARVRELLITHKKLQALFESPLGLTTMDILQWKGVVEQNQLDVVNLHKPAEESLTLALDDLLATREREGLQLSGFIAQRCKEIKLIVKNVRIRRKEVVAVLREKVLKRIDDLDIGSDSIDNNRLEQELVFHTQRLDVDEELDRLDAHLIEIKDILKRDEAVGRRLDFLMQELNREANTLGSKSNDAETTKAAVDLKVLIEQMRQMEYKDYYKILGIERDTPQDELKKAYRKLARKYHPDVSKESNAEERFKEVNEAYEVLGDAEKRASYDQLGANWKNGQNFNPPPDWEGGFDFNQFGGGGHSAGGAGFSDFFESMFGGGMGGAGFQQGQPHQQRTRKPPSQTASVSVDLEDVYSGGSTRVVLSGGKTLNVKIPKGIEEGKKIRLSGKASNGGDLLLQIHIRKHPRYILDGSNVSVNLPIAPWEAALGASIEVETLSGKLKLKIPAGSQSGKKMRLKGRGLPTSANSTTKGDQLVVLQMVTPPANTGEEKEYYEEMQKKFDWNPR
ncbi:Curved DNA-binding protein [Nymphon striatum]|nr:Curved DNA-binding protein [Nymphon striatum]